MSGEPVDTIDSRGKRLRRWYYIDIQRSIEPEDDREEAILSIPEDRIVRDNFGRDVIADYSKPELECASGVFPLSVVFDSDSDAAGHRRPGTSEANHYAERMDELPVHLVVIVERAALLTPFPALNQSTFAGGSSIYPIVRNLMLAIPSEGPGTSLTMLLNNEAAGVKQLLDIPDDFALAAHFGVGWPAQPHPTRLRRRQVEDFTSVDVGGSPLHPGDAVQGSPEPAVLRSRKWPSPEGLPTPGPGGRLTLIPGRDRALPV